ncbi:MAG: GAF domain-containing protein [Tannerellaceae bacterium]|jgi:GAF domain-containing protein|nr:GAF domain-containing protein [Tannerellaceae bacterium]
MAEDLIVRKGSKEDMYMVLLPQIEALLAGETDMIAAMANVAAALKQTFGFFWVGFYRVKGDLLVLAPFQGPVACSRIKYGKGVCGTAWKDGQTVIVPNVEEFPGHIACNAASKSEIVVPLIRDNNVIAVLDIDSDSLNSFNEVDALYLERICRLINVGD